MYLPPTAMFALSRRCICIVTMKAFYSIHKDQNKKKKRKKKKTSIKII